MYWLVRNFKKAENMFWRKKYHVLGTLLTILPLKILNEKGKLIIGGYGEVHYNQEINRDIRYNGKLDVHRMVMLMGYKFNPKNRIYTKNNTKFMCNSLYPL